MRNPIVHLSPLPSFTPEQLFWILEAATLEDLKKKNFNAMQLALFNAWGNTLFFKRHLAYPSYVVESTSVLIDIAAYLPYLSLGANLLIGLTMGCFAISAFAGIGAAYYQYKKNTRKNEETQKFFSLSSLKLAAAEELSAYLETKIDTTISWSSPKNSASPMKALGVGLGCSLLLLGTYYLGISSSLEALGWVATGAMTGFVGAVIAISIIAVIGSYVGYQYYQAKKRAAEIKTAKADVTRKVENVTQQCKMAYGLFNSNPHIHSRNLMHSSTPVSAFSC